MRDAAWMVVRFAKPSSNRVVVQALTMEGSICPQRARREAGKFHKSNEQLQLDQIKTFENVCRATADGEVEQAGFLEAQGNKLPSEKVIVLPCLDRVGRPPQGGDSPEPIRN